MSLSFPIQNNNYIIGKSGDAETLTASYAGNTHDFVIEGMVQLNLEMTYTPKTGETDRNLYIQIETGSERTDLYMYTVQSVGTAYTDLYQNENRFKGAVGGTVYKFPLDLPISNKVCRVSVKEDGSADFGTIIVKAVLSGK